MLDYTILYKSELDLEADWGVLGHWDLFLSGYTAAERVRYVYDKVSASQKHWLVFPEYRFPAGVCTPEPAYSPTEYNEADYIQGFWAGTDFDCPSQRLCIDIT